MLNRRTFCKALTALGIGMLLPALRPTDSSAIPAKYRVTCGPGSATFTTRRLNGPAATTAQDVAHQNSVLNSLLELERCADLLDELDCIEIVTNYVGRTEFSRCAGDANFWRTYCPFCDQRNLRSLEVKTEYFNCDWCDRESIFMPESRDCHEEASGQLVALLTAGTLQGPSSGG